MASPWLLAVVPLLLPIMALNEMAVIRSRRAEIARGDFSRWH
ncbi:hypothetical protein [Actinomadura sp. J1-007]|nr:hypothetical protein [Actinomadura sp. J1-007]